MRNAVVKKISLSCTHNPLNKFSINSIRGEYLPLRAAQNNMDSNSQ